MKIRLSNRMTKWWSLVSMTLPVSLLTPLDQMIYEFNGN